jgi:acetyltransferase-like isoleucine patch superfamily enzyme
MKNIVANKINIGKNVEISSKAKIICDKISIGDGTVITGNTVINCKECVIGKNNFIFDTLIEGSLNAGNTRIKIGDENLIARNTRLNCNDYIEIGNDVNMGDIQIFTHSSSMNVLNGYPFRKAPVKIGSHVWINIGTLIHPGVTIGSHIIILNNSIVNKDIPTGSLAGGVPVKIIRENYYPKSLSWGEKRIIIEECIRTYKELLEEKPFSAKIYLFK